jgi:membrane fusion protein, copper/silver efflux system
MKYSNNPIVMALAVAIGLGLTGCRGDAVSNAAIAIKAQTFPQLVQKDGQESLLLKADDVPGMTYTQVQEIPLPGILETTGQVNFEDDRVTTISSRVQGRIENVRVATWDPVRRGEDIVELYSPDFMLGEAEYLQAQQTARVTTHSSIVGSLDLAQSMILAARRKLQLLGMTDADIDAIKSPATTIWMRAPISGTVVQNKAMIGSAVNPGDVLYQLGTLNRVWITADIYEVDLARVRAGQELEAVTTSYPDEVFKGRIARVSPNIDPNAHTAQIRCEVENPDLKLKPQMLARVRIVTNPGSALVVPQQALVFDGDSYCAFVEVTPGSVQRRTVDIGSWNEHGYARVLSGLKAGERVIVKQAIQVNALWHQAHGESS